MTSAHTPGHRSELTISHRVPYMSIYEQGLSPAPVNHIALSPLSFIERTASVYPHYPAVIHGSIRRT